MLYAKRIVRICAATLVFVVWFVWRGWRNPSTRPALVRWYFQFCGGAFIKLGQLMATRYDLLPLAYSQELATLLDRVQPQQKTNIRALLEKELGEPLENCFTHFDFTPIGSASIAQVHRAELTSGQKVAVKIKRPLSEELFKIDLSILTALARLSRLLGIFVGFDAMALTEELARMAQQEFDFGAEARNIQIMHNLMVEDEIAHYAPHVYFEYCSKSVIVMELLEGVWLTEVLNAVENRDYKRLDGWGINPEEIGTTLLYSIAIQCYRHRVFHADPHPGNIIVMPAGKLGYIDFGLIGWLDERQVLQEFKLNRHVINGEFHAAYLSLLNIIDPSSGRNLRQFEIEVKELLRTWAWDIQNIYAPVTNRSTATLLLGLLAILRQHHVTVPVRTLRLYRTFIVSDMLILKLAPNLNRFDLLRAFIEDELLFHQKTTFLALTNADNLTAMLIDGLGSVQDMLALLHRVQETAPDFLKRIYQSPTSPIQLIALAVLQNIYNLMLWFGVILVASKLLVYQSDTVWGSLLSGLSSNFWQLVLVLVVLLILLRNAIYQLKIGN